MWLWTREYGRVKCSIVMAELVRVAIGEKGGRKKRGSFGSALSSAVAEQANQYRGASAPERGDKASGEPTEGEDVRSSSSRESLKRELYACSGVLGKESSTRQLGTCVSGCTTDATSRVSTIHARGSVSRVISCASADRRPKEELRTRLGADLRPRMSWKRPRPC